MKNKPVFYWDNRVLKKINPDVIVALEVTDNYTKVFLEGEPSSVLIRCTLDNALKVLPADQFIRIHRTYAVSIYAIQEVKRESVLVGNQELPVSKQYYKQVIAALGILR